MFLLSLMVKRYIYNTWLPRRLTSKFNIQDLIRMCKLGLNMTIDFVGFARLRSISDGFSRQLFSAMVEIFYHRILIFDRLINWTSKDELYPPTSSESNWFLSVFSRKFFPTMIGTFYSYFRFDRKTLMSD